MKIVVIGFGNIGKAVREEFKALHPAVCDPFIAEYKEKPQGCFDVGFVCVPTESAADGSCDVSAVEDAVGRFKDSVGALVIKSAVPPGTARRLRNETGAAVAVSPEYYGLTAHSKRDMPFVILGGEPRATAEAARAYSLVKAGSFRIFRTDYETAELAKYMENCFLALKVTFCSEFADIAEGFGVEYEDLRELFTLDERVGASHTFVYKDKPFYDSHCLNKDTLALLSFAGDRAPLMRAMADINLRKKAAAGK
jgi:UDPglucose 6-dehydrogenase